MNHIKQSLALFFMFFFNINVNGKTVIKLNNIINNTNKTYKIYTNQKFIYSSNPSFKNFNDLLMSDTQSNSYAKGSLIYDIIYDKNTETQTTTIPSNSTQPINLYLRDKDGVIKDTTIIIAPEDLGSFFQTGCEDVIILGLDDSNILYGMVYRVNQTINGLSCCCLDAECQTPCTQDTQLSPYKSESMTPGTTTNFNITIDGGTDEIPVTGISIDKN